MTDSKLRKDQACATTGRTGALILAIVGIVLLSSSSASAAFNDCAVDYDGDGTRTIADFFAFAGLFGAGSSNADLNGDQAVDGFDIQTFQAYFGFTVCPFKADYQYNRVIDPVDAFIFNVMVAAGSLRADLNNDGIVDPVDVGIFNGAFGTTY